MQELVQLQNEKAGFEERKITLVAISADPPDKLALAKEKTKAEFTFLSDADGKLMDVFGLRHEGGNSMEGTDISRPAVIALERGGRIIWANYAENYRVRPSVEKIWTNIALGQKN